MNELLNKSAVAILLQKADIVEEVSDLVTYLGFCNPGENGVTSGDFWAICKVEMNQAAYPRTTTIKWVNGQQTRNQVWDDRATLSYLQRRF